MRIQIFLERYGCINISVTDVRPNHTHQDLEAVAVEEHVLKPVCDYLEFLNVKFRYAM